MGTHPIFESDFDCLTASRMTEDENVATTTSTATTEADTAPLDGGKKNKTFSSEFSTLLTCLGAAVGTGNIWRYPRILARNVQEGGGGGFIMCWFLSLIFWSIPLIILEYALGRKTGQMHINTFHKYLGNYGAWKGAFIVTVQLAVSCYYVVVVGWCFYYLGYFISHPLPQSAEESALIFSHLTEETSYPALFVFLLSILIYLGISRGVSSFEIVNQIAVPILLVIITIGFYMALFLPNASAGVRLMFGWDWSFLHNANTFIDGISQNAWDTGAGTGIYLTFATYMKKDSKVVTYALITPVINNLVSLMMGIVTFSTSFDYLTRHNPEMTQTGILNLMKDNGPANTGLTLVWMPVFFENFDNGRAVCIVFYFCLCIAGLTSIISMVEMVCRQITFLKLSRRYAAPLVSLMVCLGGFANTNVNFLANQDYVWGYGSIIAGAYFIYLACCIGAEDVRIEFLNKLAEINRDFKVPKTWALVIALFIPFQIFLLFMWWFEESLRGHHWSMGEESFTTCVVQWSLISLFLYTCNRIYIKKFHDSWKLLDEPEPWVPQHGYEHHERGNMPGHIPTVAVLPVFPMRQSVPMSTASPPPPINDLPSYEEATTNQPVSSGGTNQKTGANNPTFTID